MKILPLLASAMLAAVLVAAAPAPDAPTPLGLGELPPQRLAKGSCALFLWDRASQKRIVMAIAQPATITIMQAGRPVVLAQQEASGTVVLGFAPHAVYGDGNRRFALDITVEPTEGGGGIAHDASLTVTAADGGAVVAPVAGIIGCAS